MEAIQNPMSYLTVLEKLHKKLKPQTYVEIGVRKGHSINLSSCTSIGIDPDYEKDISVGTNITLYETTSDDFFKSYDLTQLLNGYFDMAFIDGMHLAEFALRDFMNLEAHSHPGSIIIIDDILPDKIEWTSRVRKTQAWTGDVYKLIKILKRYRPELEINLFKTDMKGMAIITSLNRFSNILEDEYESIEKDILNGHYKISSIQELFDDFSPKSGEFIDSFIDQCQLEISRRSYLSLLKDTLVNNIYADYDLRIAYINEYLANERQFIKGEFLNITMALENEYKELIDERKEGRFYKRKIANSGFAHSMIGTKRMHALISCLDIIRKNQIPGEFVECGVWRGGSSIMMAAYNKTYMLNKKVLVADSFDGLPKPDNNEDLNLDLSKDNYPELAIPLDVVKNNFKIYNLLTDSIHFLKGWFKDTLPPLKGKMKISLLRLDGDLYSSTMDTLTNLYDDVVEGGIIYVDDWGIKNCEEAVLDFFQSRNIEMPELIRIDWTGRYWIKQSQK